jgi:hypothetical protein
VRTLEEYKKIYWLWVRFLQLSDDYKKYCRMLAGSQEYSDAEYEEYESRFYRIYDFFGRIDDQYDEENFNNWWEDSEIFKRLQRYERNVFRIDEEIERYSRLLSEDIIEREGRPRKRLQHNIIKNKLEELLGEGPRSITLIVHINDSVTNLAESFKTALKEHRSRNPTRTRDTRRSFIPLPHGKFSLPKLELYLKFYKSYRDNKGQIPEGQLWRHIINEVYPDSIPEHHNVQPELYEKYFRYAQRGEKIKNNAETGHPFPW